MEGRVLLNVKRFAQKPSECAVAASATLANYYDPEIEYKDARKLVAVRLKKSGLWTSQQCRLLNKLGRKKVTIVTADLDMVDFSWSGLSKKSKIAKLEKMRTYYGRSGYKDDKKCVHDLVEWLSDPDYDNNLIIDYDFAKHIKRRLKQGYPVGVAINWTSFMRRKKEIRHNKNGDIKGDASMHALVLRGFDSKGVFVVDSHTVSYRGKLEKYRGGFYKVSWEQFLVNIPRGDVILA